MTDGDFDGLVAIGGDLSPERLILAYRSGIFPWSVDPITWWSPSRRGIIPLDAPRWGRSLLKTIRRKPFEVSVDRAFREVMEGCRTAPRQGSWITTEFVEAYTVLHDMGFAHSVECWSGEDLAGGIYGIHVGGAFVGESMFFRESNASKVALYYLVESLRANGFTLFDTQMVTETTERFGAREISRDEYLRLLVRAARLDCEFPVKIHPQRLPHGEVATSKSRREHCR
ncbi:MAG: leucyl/phenylalanyl-tRNA--protein transferase [Verrucomicrobiales bacterium]|nr:leucyl/phenylalanyl-tRNA--protein transferase [Verrucomicrobiales bacterium]